jgi:hypothetical protein
VDAAARWDAHLEAAGTHLRAFVPAPAHLPTPSPQRQCPSR